MTWSILWYLTGASLKRDYRTLLWAAADAARSLLCDDTRAARTRRSGKTGRIMPPDERAGDMAIIQELSRRSRRGVKRLICLCRGLLPAAGSGAFGEDPGAIGVSGVVLERQ